MPVAEVYFRGIKKGAKRKRRIGVFFTKYSDEARFYGEDVQSYKLTPQRPLFSETAVDAAEKLGVRDKYLELVAKDVIAADNLISRAALEKGYDALIRREGDWIIALKPRIIGKHKSPKHSIGKRKFPRITPERPRLER